MTWVNGWSLHRFCEGEDRANNDVYDLVEKRLDQQVRLVAGVAVSGPSRRGQRPMLDDFVRAFECEAWDGRIESVFDFWKRVETRFCQMPLATEYAAGPERDGVAIGGVAYSRDEALVAFRLGGFRITTVGGPIYWEQTAAQAARASGKVVEGSALLKLANISEDVLPHRRWTPECFFVADESWLRVSVYHSRDFAPVEPIPHLLIGATRLAEVRPPLRPNLWTREPPPAEPVGPVPVSWDRVYLTLTAAFDALLEALGRARYQPRGEYDWTRAEQLPFGAHLRLLQAREPNDELVKVSVECREQGEQLVCSSRIALANGAILSEGPGVTASSVEQVLLWVGAVSHYLRSAEKIVAQLVPRR